MTTKIPLTRALRNGLLFPLLGSLILGSSLWAQDGSSQDSSSRHPGAQDSSRPAADPADGDSDQNRENKVGLSLLRNLEHDQWAIWTSPAHIKLTDLYWIFPVAGVLTGINYYDSDITDRLPSGASLISRSTSLSNYGVAAVIGASGGMYLLGHLTNNEHERETGFLSGEAALDSFAVVTVGKYAAGRQRPNSLIHSGDFLAGGASFPSAHAAISFSIATVIANEYPGLGTKLLSYGAATGVSAARVLGRDHFVSDVAVGAAIGWFSGRQVYRAHHKLDLPGANIGTIERAKKEERVRTPGEMGSPYVELDSWVYPALDRLAAFGLIRTAFASIRPWTRMECARQIGEAGEKIGSDNEDSPAYRIYAVLKSEFAPELRRLDGAANIGVTVESIYTRSTYISGQPLTNSYHIGQTIVNDFGRPFQEGFNSINGGSARAVLGPFVFYVRGEYQHSPGAPALPQQALSAFATLDFHPAISPIPVREVNRARLLDAYVGIQMKNWLLSFGKQSMWWGPGENAPTLFSDNAEPITMLKVDRVTPFRIPGVSRVLGPLRVEGFLGQLSGHNFVNTELGLFSNFGGRPVDPQPFIHGEKLSMKPTPNFEFSVSRTGIFGGPAFPFNMHRFLPVFFSDSNAFGPKDPGDRRSATDMSYRFPKLRDWLTLYLDAFTEDQPSPLLFPERSAVSGGFHMPKLPKFNNVEFWAEGSYTDLPAGTQIKGFHYFNIRYLDGYTNQGNLLAGWVGRQGAGGAVGSRWWIKPDSSIELSYRNIRTPSEYLQGGSRQHDFGCKVDINVNSGFRIGGSAQYEWWRIPVLSTKPEQNVAVSIQVSYLPKWLRRD